MRIDERLASGDPCFSFEFFPPRTDEGERNLGRALSEPARLDPAFVSVTYGAAGTTDQKLKTLDIVTHARAEYGLEAMAHFPPRAGRVRARGDGPLRLRRGDRA